ncbi:MAG: tryptophan 7-halogenase [Rudaea sp.]|nr:tryptophan 7-halogenase [Rudaea sp.]
MADFDVLIAGGGPGGCAAAISLRNYAPALRVCVADPGTRSPRNLGETLPPQAGVFLDHLGIRERFVGDGHVRAYRTESAWGSEHPIANDFLYGVHQCGWRLDRERFDALLAQTARERGVDWRRDHVASVTRLDEGWAVRFRDGGCHTARFLVDATGRNASLCRQLGIVTRRDDRLIASVVRFAPQAEPIDLTVEPCADGWWYATALADRTRVLACMSDSDIVREQGLAGLDGWLQRLDATRCMRALAAGLTPLEAPQLYPAASLHRSVPAALPMLAVGDAASAFDPLSSQGIAKALRSGVFASYAVADSLLRGDERGRTRYRDFIADEFTGYRETLAQYYGRERRWSDRPFWQRRHANEGASGPPQLTDRRESEQMRALRQVA